MCVLLDFEIGSEARPPTRSGQDSCHRRHDKTFWPQTSAGGTLADVPEVQLLTNHGLALLCVARDPGARIRDIAECVGVTERAAHRIVCELCAAGYITRTRNGRRNAYEVHPDAPLPHAMLGGHTAGELLREVA